MALPNPLIGKVLKIFRYKVRALRNERNIYVLGNIFFNMCTYIYVHTTIYIPMF